MYISQIEADERVPAMKTVMQIAENLGLDLPRFARFAFRAKYGDEIWDMISQEMSSEEREHKISPELKYILWTVENLPEEKRKQIIRAMEEILKIALI